MRVHHRLLTRAKRGGVGRVQVVEYGRAPVRIDGDDLHRRAGAIVTGVGAGRIFAGLHCVYCPQQDLPAGDDRLVRRAEVFFAAVGDAAL